MCARNGLSINAKSWRPSASSKHWRTSTGLLTRRSSASKFTSWPALKAGFVVLYRSIFDLARELQAETSPAELDRCLARYLKADLLIIDDMGLKTLPPKAGEVLLEIVLRRYENRSTLMTSNRPIEDWGKLLNDVPTATAILDRFLHHAEVIQMTGRSYRLKQGAARNADDTK